MRAILIDPEKRTITQIQLEPGIENICGVLKCRQVGTGAHLRGTIEEGFDIIFVSDDDLAGRAEEELRCWFQIDADRNPPGSFPIAGLGLALGNNRYGEMCDVGISVAELT